MTVIATDGRTIAADGRVTLGHSEIGSDRVRKIVVRGRRIFALTGVGALLEPLIAWHDAGADPEKIPALKDGKKWTFIVIDNSGSRSYSSICPYPANVNYPATFGCGCDYAMGAMLAGASPKRAVEIAIEKDVFCGGHIEVIDIEKVLGAVKEAAE